MAQHHLIPNIPPNQHIVHHILLHPSIDSHFALRIQHLAKHLLQDICFLIWSIVLIHSHEQFISLQQLDVPVQCLQLNRIQLQRHLFTPFEILPDECTFLLANPLSHQLLVCQHFCKQRISCLLLIFGTRHRLILLNQLRNSLSEGDTHHECHCH